MNIKKQLHRLYQNKELLIFVNGLEWFNEQVYALHRQQVQNEKDIIIEAACFELDNGYEI